MNSTIKIVKLRNKIIKYFQAKVKESYPGKIYNFCEPQVKSKLEKEIFKF